MACFRYTTFPKLAQERADRKVRSRILVEEKDLRLASDPIDNSVPDLSFGANYIIQMGCMIGIGIFRRPHDSS